MDQQTAIEELRKLSSQVDQVVELPALKPIYARLAEISKLFPGDFDVQAVSSELKQKLVSHGQKLKDAALGATGVTPIGLGTSESVIAPPPPVAPPPPPPPSVSGRIPSGQSPAQPPMTTGPSPLQSGSGYAPPPPPQPSGEVRSPSSGPRPTSFQTSGIAPPQAPPKAAAPNFKRALMIGAGVGLAAFAVIFVFLVQMARQKNIAKDAEKEKEAAAGKVVVEITTVPEGAEVLVSNAALQERCKSNCKVSLAPGSYTINAQLDGYDPAASGVVVAAGGSPIPIAMTLTAQAQGLRILSDVSGKVSLDGKPVGDIQEGQFIIDRLPLGDHTVTISGGGSEASFAFKSDAGRAPVVTTPATAKNLLAVLLASGGAKAKLHTSSGPMKFQIDGQARGDVGPGGSDLDGLSAGEHELIVGEGKDAKKVILSFAQTPIMTAYLKSDVNAGFLVVVAGAEDDVAVTVAGRLQNRKTARGQMRVQLPPGKYPVKIAKDGFEAVAEQTAEIKKGEDTKLAFTMKALPRVASLKVTGATPGANITLDRAAFGKVGADGTFSGTVTQLGDKVLEFTLAGFNSRQYQKSFKAGETVAITDAVLAAATGTLRLNVTPAMPETKVTVRREGDQPRTVSESTLAGLAPGNYTLVASAKGYTDRTERVTVAGGETRAVDLALRKEAVAAPVQPVVRAGGIGDLEGSFTRDGDAYVQKGPATVMFKNPQTNGTFTFTVKPLKGRKIRWIVGQKDARNYALFEMEKNKLVRRDVSNGKDKKLGESPKFDQQDAFVVQIDVKNGSLIHKVSVGGNWMVVDNWVDASRNFGDGRFGFQVEGRDEIALTDFKFVPAR